MAKEQALGMIETLGLSALIAAADSAAKTSAVQIYTYEKADAGIMTVYLFGDVSSVKEAVNAGMERAKAMGKLLHYHVIPNPGIDFTLWIKQKRGKPKASNMLEETSKEGQEQLSVTELRQRVRHKADLLLTSTAIRTADKDTLLKWLTEGTGGKE